jgi:peptidyl-prolyl cis-trans isomerase D
MLESLRKGAGSWVAKFFLVLLVISFAFWGISGQILNYNAGSLATVGSREITGAEFQRAYRNQLNALSARAGRAISASDARAFGLPQQVLSSLISGSALDQEAAKLGLGLPDEAIREKIVAEKHFQDLTGKFSKKTFDAALREQGLSEQGYVTQERRNALREQILDIVEHAPDAPRTLLEAMNRFQNEERTIQHFVIPEDVAGAIEDPGEDALKTYYDGHKGQFTAPEYRKLVVLALTPESYKDNVKVDDKEIKDEFEAHKDKYSEPEQREIQQISFSKPEAAKTAKEKLDQGADFMTVAKDAGFKETDVDLGLVAKSALVDPKVADAAFSIEKDKISAPIEGALSTAIIRVTKIVPAGNKSLDDVKDQIRAPLALQRAADETSKLFDKIEDERAAGTSLPEIAKKFNIPLFEAVTDKRGKTPDGKDADLHGYARELLKPAFETKVGVENPAVRLGGKGDSWFDLVEIIPERLKPLAEIRDEAVKSWRDDEARARLAKKAQELVAQGAKTTDDFTAMAKSVNAEAKTTKPLKRAGAEPGLPLSAIKKAFGLKEGVLAFAPAAGSKGQAVFRVESVTAPKPLDEAGAGALRKRLENAIGGDVATQYVAGLQRTHPVRVNERAFQSAMGGETPDDGPRGVQLPDFD